MRKDSKLFGILLLCVLLACCLIGCGNQETVNNENQSENSKASELSLDMTKWNYDTDNNVYYQIGVQYCSKPETTIYETLGIYVPGNYFTSTSNEDGTYTCTINKDNKIGNYTASSAPIVLPVNTAGYSAQKAPTSYSYSGLSDYLDAGFVYVYAGCRGRNEGETDYSTGAPWGVTDLKAAVRFLRYNKDVVPANTDAIFTFGHSGGGAQSSLMGATGDSTLYTPYLESIGAAMTDSNGNTISDAIMGAMCWCPITNLDVADEAYEWNMGQFMTSETRTADTYTKAVSDDLAKAYANYINELGLKDKDGNSLTLEASEDGIYLKGSYYDYLLNVIETSLNNFLQDTTFPYTPSNSFKADGGFGGNGDSENGNRKMNGEGMNRMPSGERPTEKIGDDINFGGMRQGKRDNSQVSDSTTYNTVAEYINKLNENGQWINYDSDTNTAKILSLEGFVTSQKSASKNVGAFDSFDKTQAENKVFGNDNESALHFDKIMANILNENNEKYSAYTNYDTSYATSYKEDLENRDKLGKTVLERQDMYNPMYFISDYYDGYHSSNLAKYWRINTGITQGDTGNVTEMNLGLALQNNSNVKSVDFTTVWGQGHTTAERTGSSTTNFIDWVNECLK